MPLTVAERAIAATMKDPLLYARRILRHDVWDIPGDVLRSVRDNPRTAVKACHASSKSHTAAEAALWWFDRYPDGKVLTTAPTWTQVERVMWGEIHRASLGGLIARPKVLATEIASSSDHFIIGISTNQGVRFQGWHGRVLIIVDEAPGVKADIWEAMEGVRAGGDVRILALGNPTMVGGEFYTAFTNRRAGWATFTIDGLNTPNTRDCGPTPDERLAEIVRRGDAGDDAFLDTAVRPYLIQRRFIYEKYHEWGPDDPRFQSRVRGQFPSNAENAVFPLAWLERNALLVVARTPGVPLVAGIDVAGPGEDETVLVVRQGPKVLGIYPYTQADPRGPVAAVLNAYGGPQAFDYLNIDGDGLGHYFVLHFRDLGYRAHALLAQQAPSDRERFPTAKSERHWGLRDRLAEDDARGITDETTIGQLAAITWAPDARGRTEVESKDALRVRGVKSPDRAEAVILAFAPPPPDEFVAVIPPSVSYNTY